MKQDFLNSSIVEGRTIEIATSRAVAPAPALLPNERRTTARRAVGALLLSTEERGEAREGGSEGRGAKKESRARVVGHPRHRQAKLPMLRHWIFSSFYCFSIKIVRLVRLMCVYSTQVSSYGSEAQSGNPSPPLLRRAKMRRKKKSDRGRRDVLIRATDDSTRNVSPI